MKIILKVDPDFKGRLTVPAVQRIEFLDQDFNPTNSLVVLNGKILRKSEKLRIFPAGIRNLIVLNKETAKIKYGISESDGVLEIELQNRVSESILKDRENVTEPDSGLFESLISINYSNIREKPVDISVNELKDLSIWTYKDVKETGRKELRTINFRTKDYFVIKGVVNDESGEVLPGVKVTVSENPNSEYTDKNGQFILRDGREMGMLEFSAPGYKSYYLMKSFGVVFSEELEITLEKEGR